MFGKTAFQVTAATRRNRSAVENGLSSETGVAGTAETTANFCKLMTVTEKTRNSPFCPIISDNCFSQISRSNP